MVDSDNRSKKDGVADGFPDEPVVINPGDTLDLHTFLPKEIPSLLDEFFSLCQESDINLVRIIHGKGSGMLRRRVQSLLERDPRVVAFYDASARSGGWGATIVELRFDEGEHGKKT